MNDAPSVQKRDNSIDLLKTIAIFCVLLIHTAATSMYGPIPSPDWYASVFWGSISRFAVPVFFMCSGALMLRPGKDLPLKRLWGKSILRLVLAMLFWAFAYKCFHLLAAGSFNLPALWQGFKEVLLFNQEFHLYFLHIILLVYALLPVLRVISANADKKLLQYLLLMWLLLGIIFPTVRPYWPFSLLDGIPAKWMLNMTYSSIGYCFLGYYMKSYPLKGKAPYWALLVLGFGIIMGGTLISSLQTGSLDEHFLEGMTLGVCLMSAGIFGLCLGFSPKKRVAKLVLHLSKASFCIYLVHAFFLPKILVLVGLYPLAVSIPILAFINLLLSLLVYEVLSRIPVVNKWLI